MKKIVIFLMLCGFMFTAIPQARAEKPTDPMEVGTWIVNAGIGLSGYGYGDGVWLYGFGIKGAIQKGLWQAGPGVISLGGEAGVALSSYHGLNYTRFNIAPRSSYHYGWNVPGLDTYGGITLGVGFVSNNADNGSNVRFYGGLYAGGSYFFTNAFGVNAEVGLGTTMLQVGLAYRF